MAKDVSQIVKAQLLAESELTPKELELLAIAKGALENAYAPYSNFHVGSSLLLENGEIIIGSNQENAAYPSGLCAERVAIFSAGANYPGVKIKQIIIGAKPLDGDDYVMASSCGNCRQAMMEYQSRQDEPIELLFMCPNKEYLKTTVSDLLPFGFDSVSLLGG